MLVGRRPGGEDFAVAQLTQRLGGFGSVPVESRLHRHDLKTGGVCKRSQLAVIWLFSSAQSEIRLRVRDM